MAEFGPPSPTEPPSEPAAGLKMNWEYAAPHFILAALYLIPLALCIKRSMVIITSCSWSNFWQINFSVFMLLGCGVRMTSWTVTPFVFAGFKISKVASFYWNFYPSFFFLSLYAVILFTWMEIYHSPSNDHKANLKPIYIYASCTIYLACIGIMIGDIVLGGQESFLPLPDTLLQRSLNTFDGILYLVLTIGYLIYGGSFYIRFSYQKTPLLSQMKEHILPRVKILTSLTTVCFIIRGIVTIESTWRPWPSRMFWWIDLLYYVTLEIVPAVCMLMVLQQKAPEERPMINKAGHSTIQTK